MSSKSAPQDEEEESSSEENDRPKSVFKDEQGNPIWFFLHKSITLDWQRQNLTNSIQSNGGIVQPNDSDVDTVLVGQGCNKDNLQLAYNSHSDRSKRSIWVEPMSFVSRCLREGVVRHRQPESKGMGGSLGYRTPFTSEDDENLARYLAIKIPDNESGGRRGYNVYKELYRAYSEDPKEYAWVTRHPWQSWRNRYNKSDTSFNDIIDTYVKLKEPEHKQAYRLQRKPQGRQFIDESGEENGEQSGTPSKRHRVDLSPDPPENDVQIRRSLAGKGKERMVSEDAYHEPSSTFYENFPSSEPGPSKRMHYRSRKRPHVSPPYDPEPYTSQATLVETNYQTQEPRPRKRTVLDLTSQQRERSKDMWRETGVVVQQDRSLLLTREPNALAAPMSSAEIFGAGASTKTVATSPKHRPMARKTAQRDKTPSAVTENHHPPLEDLEIHHLPDLIGETLEEEWSVQELLVNVMSGQDDTKDDPSARNATDAVEPISLDSDDAQIDSWLHQPQIRSRIPLPAQESDVGPDEMLRRFRKNTSHSPMAREPSVRHVPFAQAQAGSGRPRHSAPVYSQDIFRVSLTEQQPRTPGTNPQSRFRRGSTSSVESFPIAGTKASAFKKNKEMEEKHTPYRPPVGTRAALLMEK